ncbi:hypothetical protein R3P38DRAFT_2804708 [Favolaschia claudopus]|uniref:Uncharacterized protein n=1 Tax=Favolaschia claudopus TaxID=2862362 RepID=A0AAV9ZP86_9AGAR
MPPRRNKNAPEPAAPLEPEPPTTEPPATRTRRGTAQLQPTAGPSRSSEQPTSSAARIASTGQEERGFAGLSYRPSSQSLRTQQSTSSLGTIPETSINAAPEVLPTRRRERGGPPEPPTPARTLIQRLAADRPPVASPGIHYAGSDDDDNDNDNDSESDDPLFDPLARRSTMRPLALFSDEDDASSPSEPSAPHSEQSAPSRASGRRRRVIANPPPPSPSPPARQPHHGGQQRLAPLAQTEESSADEAAQPAAPARPGGRRRPAHNSISAPDDNGYCWLRESALGEMAEDKSADCKYFYGFSQTDGSAKCRICQ